MFGSAAYNELVRQLISSAIEMRARALLAAIKDKGLPRFNRTYRDEILNMYVFRTLNEVRDLTLNWVREYNEERPHDSLEDLTPWEYLAKHEPQETLFMHVIN